MSMHKVACWNTDEIDRIVRTEALEGNRAVFLGAHLPIRAFDVVEGNLHERTDEGFKKALFDTRPHALALVEGEPGSGKSHLIQWLRYAWPTSPREHVVLVPRSDGSLHGTLDRLRRELGPVYAKPLEGLGDLNRFSPAGQANELIGHLVTTFKSGAYANPKDAPRHWEWLDEHQAWRIVADPELRERWTAPRTILEVLDGVEKRDQEMARFVPAHLAEMIEVLAACRAQLRDPKADRLLGTLKAELDRVRQAVQETTDIGAQLKKLELAAPKSKKFLEALNARTADVIQRLLGVTGGALQKRMLEVRRLLKGKRLVLLLEDITNLQGVDRQLIEALLPNAGSSEHQDLCELVAVVGLTPYYYDEFLAGLGNVRDRIRFHLRLTTSNTAGVVNRESRFLEESESRARFVATYLNAVRVGYRGLCEWERSGVERERPNACSGCPRGAECFSAFGCVELDRVGGGPVALYPLTRQAIDRFWDHLLDQKAMRSLKTPRGLLQNVVSVVLHERAALEARTFPSAQLEHPNLQARAPGPGIRDALRRMPQEVQAKATRALLWWGDDSDGRVTEEAGIRCFSGVPELVLAAFGIDWPGGDRVPERHAKPNGQKPGKGIAPRPPELPPAPPEVPPEWLRRLKELDRWADNQALQDAGAWERLAFECLSELKPEDYGASPLVWSLVFTDSNVVIEDTRGRQTELQFVVPRCEAAHRGLAAVARLRHGVYSDAGEAADLLLAAAEFQDWLARSAVDHVSKVDKRLGALLGGTVADVAVRNLTVMAWLGGGSDPGQAPLNVWRRAVVVWTTVPPVMRGSPDWDSLVEQLRLCQTANFEMALKDLRVGAAPQQVRESVVDASHAYRAVRAAIMQPFDFSHAEGRVLAGLKDVAPIREARDNLAKNLRAVVLGELRTVRAKVKAVADHTDGADVEAFLDLAGSVLDRAVRLDRTIVSAQTWNRWTSGRANLMTSGLATDKEKLRRLDDAMRDLDEVNDRDHPGKVFAAVLGFPQADLLRVDEAVSAAARAIEEAYAKAVVWMNQGEQDGRDALDDFGKRVIQIAGAVAPGRSRND